MDINKCANQKQHRAADMLKKKVFESDRTWKQKLKRFVKPQVFQMSPSSRTQHKKDVNYTNKDIKHSPENGLWDRAEEEG